MSGVFNHAALPGQMHITRLVHSSMCQALRVRQLGGHPRKMAIPLKTVMLALKSGPFHCPQNESSQATSGLGLDTPALRFGSKQSLKPAMSNPNGLLSQKLCHYLDQGRT